MESSKLAVNNGPVKNAVEAKAYLEQQVLIAINDNYTPESLTNILFATAMEGKVPDHVSSIIKAVGFLLMDTMADSSLTELVEVFTDKILPVNQTLMKCLENEHEFIKATSVEQYKQTLKLAEQGVQSFHQWLTGHPT